MRKAVLFLASILLLPLVARAQTGGVSFSGSVVCNAPTTTGTAWNSGTANNTTQVLSTGFSGVAVLVQLDQTTTISGGAVTFQVSYDGGVNYQSVAVAQLLNPTTGAQLTNPYTLVASTNQPFLVILAGATNLQLKLTTAITGSATVTPYTTPLCQLPANVPAVLVTAGSAAGGDLSGTYPNPVVNQIEGGVIPTSAPVTGTNSSKQPVASTLHSLASIETCADSSGSGTAQTCTFSPTLTIATNDCFIYTTTTTNSGTGLTLNPSSLGAKSIAIPGASGWTTTLTANIIPANKPLLACYDGTNINVVQTGTAASGGASTISGSSLTQYSVYYQGASALALAEANVSTTLPAICVAATTSTCQFSGALTNGSWSWTVGGVLYVSDSSAGTMTQTAPTTSTHFVQVVGVALSATQILIMPSLEVSGIQ